MSLINRTVGAVVLMAGESSRMKSGNKLLMTVGESQQSVAQRALQSIVEAGYAPIVVVTGHDVEQVRETLRCFDVQFIHNSSYKHGMGTSIAEAFRQIGDWDSALIALGDMPFVSIDTLRKLRQHSIESPAEIIAPTFNGRRGQPVIFPSQFFEVLARCKGDIGGKPILKANPDRIKMVDVDDEGIYWDVDTKENLTECAAKWSEAQHD